MLRHTGKTLSESAYDSLRDDIIRGRLEPEAKLRIEELRQHYGTGASPLREALNRLAGEGFVTTEGQRGFRVAPISLKDLKDITSLRIMLECEAITISMRNGDDEWEASIVAASHRLAKVESGDQVFPEWELRNQDFHEALIAACDSTWLLRFRRTLYEQHKRYRLISILERVESRNVRQEHDEIVQAVLARDESAACAATEKHISRTAEITEQAFANLNSSGVP
ncbi:MAG: GntR family carbon starvation induced transcriptional regulator [Gammaproteobacteria bacterium]|jgi:GntR family carbon starvation induced transcriptional regulator